MTDLSLGFDAAYPPGQPYPGASWAGGYIGGRTRHVWTAAEWNAATSNGRLRMLPIWVNDGRQGGDQAADAARAAVELGWSPRFEGKRRRAIVFDLETLVDPGLVADFAAALRSYGFVTVPYGSASTVGQNPQCAGRWVALWDGSALVEGHAAHQFSANVAFAGGAVDLSVAGPGLRARMGVGARR